MVIASDPLHVLDIQIGQPFSKTCDHFSIDLKINLTSSKPLPKPSGYNFYRGDYKNINSFLSSQPWDDLLKSSQDLNCMYSKFSSIIHQAISKFIPKYNSNKTIRFPRHITKILNKKKKVYRKMKSDPSLKKSYKLLNKLYKTEVKAHLKSTEENIIKSNNKNRFHKYIKKKN